MPDALNEFTSLQNYDDMQDLDVINELVVSFNERWLAAYTAYTAGVIPALTSNSDITIGARSASPINYDNPIHRIQYQLEEALGGAGPALVLGYLDDTQDVSGGTFIPFFTIETWRTRSGLHADGFRRVPAGTAYPTNWDTDDDPSYSHGRMQPGDIFGPWIIKDLQRGLRGLRSTRKIHDSDSATAVARTWVNEGDPAPYVCTLTEHNTSWINDSSYESTSYYTTVYQLSALLYTGLNTGDDGSWYSHRSHCKGICTGLYTGIYSNWEFYVLPTTQDVTYPPPYGEFDDLDGIGWTKDEYWLVETETTLQNTSSRECSADLMADSGHVNDCPCYQHGEPSRTDEALTIFSNIQVGYAFFIIKWQFTYGYVSP